MREIKFRGKSLNSGKWVYGLLTERVCGGNYHRYINQIESNPVRVGDNTIGEYTGCNTSGLFGYMYEGDTIENEYDDTFVIAFRKGSFVGVHEPSCRAEAEGECKTDYLVDLLDAFKLEVIGNIHEEENK